MSERCLTCGKAMKFTGSGDDRDCGGDCWGCMKELAPDDPDVVRAAVKEIMNRYRKAMEEAGWPDDPRNQRAGMGDLDQRTEGDQNDGR